MAAPVLASPRPGVRLAASGAAQSFARADVAWQRETHGLIRLNSAYRPWDTQLGMYQAWQRYLHGGPKPPHSMALHPDQSKHCLGLAVDTPDWTVPGFLAHMAEHGWIQVAPNDPTERHHLEYQASRDRHRNESAGTGYEQIEDDDMTPQEFLDTKIEIVPGRPETTRSVAQALRAIFTETEATIQRVDTARDQIADVAGAVWAHPLGHTLARDADENPVLTPAGDHLRYNSAEHQNTRNLISMVTAPDVDEAAIAAALRASGLVDAHAIAIAAADEADRRDRERLGKV